MGRCSAACRDLEEVSRFYGNAVNAYIGGEWTRGELLLWLERELPEVVAEVNAAIAIARSVANNTTHETLLNVSLDHSSWRTTVIDATADNPAGPEGVAVVDVTLPDSLSEYLVGCQYDRLLSSVRRSRLAWLAKKDVDSLKRLAWQITEFMQVDAPTALPAPSRRVDRAARFTAVAGGASWAIAKLVFGGLDTFTGPELLLAGLGGAAEMSGTTKNYLANALQSLGKREIVHQIIQTFRDHRGGE